MALDVDAVIARAKEAGMQGDFAEAWRVMRPHHELLDVEPSFAWAWLVLVRNGPEMAAHRHEVEEILDAWQDDPHILVLGATILYVLVDGRLADDPIPVDDPALRAAVCVRLALGLYEDDERLDPEVGGHALVTLANALRLAGPAHDEEAQQSYERALEMAPAEAGWWFDLGLLYKHRARWREALDAFEKARALEEDEEESTLVNIAICATALGDASTATAIEAWGRLGVVCVRGDDGLPRVSSDSAPVKVRLSTMSRDPGAATEQPILYEHVWVAPDSPCHGRVLDPTMLAVGVDVGDVVLFDRAPVGVAVVDGRSVLRFPLLALLQRGVLETTGVSARDDTDLARLRAGLRDGERLYMFDENVELVCDDCIRTGGPHDARHTAHARPAGPRAGKIVRQR